MSAGIWLGTSWMLAARSTAQEESTDTASSAESMLHVNVSGTELCESSTLFNSSVAGDCLELYPCCDWQAGVCVSAVGDDVCSVACDTDGGGCIVEESGWSVGVMVAVVVGSICWCCVCD